MKISPVLDGAAAFLRNHVSANPKLIPERGEIEGDNVGERCVLNLSSPCVCVCVCVQSLLECLLLATLRHSLYGSREKGAAPKLHECCDWLRGKPDVCPLVMWTWWFHLIVWLHSGDGFTRLLLRHSDFFLIYACTQITTGREMTFCCFVLFF